MKQGTLVTRLIILVLFLGIMAYLGVSFVTGLFRGVRTEPVYSYTVDRGIAVSGLVARDEAPIYSDAQLVDVLPAEGKRVGSGQVVAKVYRSGEDLAREQERERIDLQLQQLSYLGATGKLTADSVAIERELASGIPVLRAAAAARELTALPETAQQLKLLLSLRSYAYNGTHDAEALEASLRERLRVLEAAGGGGTVDIRVDTGGIFSALVDGFEALLPPGAVLEMTPAAFAGVFAQAPAVPQGAIGKLIYGSRWYFAALLTEEEGIWLSVGQSVPLRFLRGFTETMRLRVDRISEPENGRVLVVFSSDRYLSETTLLRSQNAELILETHTGLRVSKRALRVLEDGTTGVYCAVGVQAKFKPAVILHEGDDYYLLRAADESSLSALRAGDEVIVSGAELYDGKVVREG